ncbi:MAG TPA: hypothetical protein VJJ26_02640 [Candidatus Babeliales bacterium]|nr:hypothetical protein [Candidatus Babeliales bacterium]
MLHTIKKLTLYGSGLIALICSHVSLSMDVGQIPNDKIIVFSTVIKHGSLNFDHETVCSLALVNKEFEGWIKRGAQERKTYLTKLRQKSGQYFGFFSLRDLDVYEGSVWHKYGGAVGIKESVSNSATECYRVKLECFYLSRGTILGNRCIWCVCYSLADDFTRPKFNDKGDLYFYGLGSRWDMKLWNREQHLIEYSLLKDGSSRMKRCGLKIQNGNYNCTPLSLFVPFTALLKALLNSSVEGETASTRVYNLKDAIIPDNYKECDSSNRDMSFENLPEELRDAIIKRYNDQQSKK